MKLRALGGYANYIQTFGANPVNIPTGELYMALKLGTIDGYVMGTTTLDSEKLKEVVKYFVLDPNLNVIGQMLHINRDSFNALPDDIKALIKENLKYLALGFSAQYYTAAKRVPVKAEADGYLKIISWSDADKARAREAGIKTWDDIAKLSPNTAKLVDIVKAQAKDLGKIK